MESKLVTYNVQDWTVLGRNRFAPPFKVSDTLINEARIVHVARGSSILCAANQYTEFQSGDTFIMKSDNFINQWQENPSGELNEVIVFQLTSDFLKHVYQNHTPQWLSSKSAQQVFPIRKASSNFLLDNYLLNLKHYLDNPRLITEELIRMKVQELIYVLINTDKSGDTRKVFESLFLANEYEFQEVIQAHLFDNLNLEDLAFLTGLSLSSFKRKFSAVYGISPNKYFISKRLEQAQVLLSTTDLRISEIAYDCGFSDVGYFTKTFQKYYNCSPSTFRENLLN